MEDRKLEIDWRRRSRQLWLQEGDAKTKFFYLVANSRPLLKSLQMLAQKSGGAGTVEGPPD